jgi:Pyruvate/2-oxoacid:ferredoxin oxidoreductase delta subunit
MTNLTLRPTRRPDKRPDIKFIPMSTDADKIRFFGNLMPAALLLRQSPREFLSFQLHRRLTPRREVAEFIQTEADDAARWGDTLVFIHRWHTVKFDSLVFARARVFLEQLTRMVRRAGYSAEALDPLSPGVNLPRLAAQAGLGNLSPYGLLVHPVFGPRLIITALKTNYALEVKPRFGGDGCEDCFACIVLCPQQPAVRGVIDLSKCQSCAECLIVCPTGKGRRARFAREAMQPKGKS